MENRRAIPSIDRLLDRPGLAEAIARHGRPAVVDAARRSADLWRIETSPSLPAASPTPDAGDWIEARTLGDLTTRTRPSLVPVINATGVIIHTNLGRAPLAGEAIAHVGRVAAGYTNLEYDLPSGTRGRRHVHAESLLRHLTGAEAALVTNNNAAAALVALAALAAGREVIVSRGELVEIGGGFRVPDILGQSGAVLREVGTTNRTRAADYAAAIGDRTAAILRVHPSNFRIAGFTERPQLAELASLAHQFHLPLIEDLGSGWLGLADLSDAPEALRHEPSVVQSLRDGADVVAFSGDKLLGGPQAGILVGRADLIAAMGRHPLMRAVRADKLAYAALEATLALWAKAPSRHAIPVFEMLTASAAVVRARARRHNDNLGDIPGLTAVVADGSSTPGGGSAPAEAIPTAVVHIRAPLTAAALHERLRHGDRPVVARIEDDAVVLDLRTVRDVEVDPLADAVRQAVRT